MVAQVNLKVLEGEYAVSLLPHDEPVPAWANGPGFVNMSCCDDEMSIVCLADRVPKNVRSDGGWTALPSILELIWKLDRMISILGNSTIEAVKWPP